MNIYQTFENLGAKFYHSPEVFAKKIATIRAYIFDWDGVFNDGSKTEIGSPYSEIDSMGTNMLRFATWLQHKQVAATAIITGENNKPAFYLAQRERFQAVYFKFSSKQAAFTHFLEQNKLQASEVCFCFDDILDLSVAEQCGLRILVRRDASPLFLAYVEKNHLADYRTANIGGKFAVRELMELILGVQNIYDLVIQKRQYFDKDYQTYLATRNEQKTSFFVSEKAQIQEIKMEL
jgi:3-deoxy-D-manno-octulosonate 8-phosphate phosphatase (KDO 8-P phosphatase)